MRQEFPGEGVKWGQRRVSPINSPNPSQAESTACKSHISWGSVRSDVISKFGSASLSFQGGLKMELRVCCVFILCSEIKGNIE